jgi:hypothetical protein
VIDLALNCGDLRFEILIHLLVVEGAQTFVELGALAELLAVLASLAILVPSENVADCV